MERDWCGGARWARRNPARLLRCWRRGGTPAAGNARRCVSYFARLCVPDYSLVCAELPSVSQAHLGNVTNDESGARDGLGREKTRPRRPADGWDLGHAYRAANG